MNTATQPLQVEILTHTSWLALWLPFIGTVLLFAASMITLWRTNRANAEQSKAEVEAMRERDSQNWRRDQLLRIGMEVIETSYSARAELGRIALHLRRPVTRADFRPILEASHRIAGCADGLQLLGENWASIRCRALADTLSHQDVWSAVGDVSRSLVDDAEHPEAQGLDPRYDAMWVSNETENLKSELETHLSHISNARTQFNQALDEALGVSR
ncbi:hypothetical protein [Mycobacterium kubicae]|uniref:hypothetical protein n=1 Tax=Mycobacterium kubicae TaxID=120959 RepID=UPI0008019F03|nr:hypothetical protein [Mycobacterium kubicae]OBK45243.1 hypothetical protein A5657_03485 [Mycobacterium kubicae]